ncbi:MAG: hypothetical protein RBU30_18135 [Polyangia bacterium]|jgi:hypothetical protein|nr:hypothetical protein [Polyangia bacterium]
MSLKDEALKALRDYLRENPREIARTLRSAVGLRASVPLAAFRWIADRAVQSGAVKSLRISFRDPGIHFVADVDLMETPVRAHALVFIERVVLSEEELTLAIRVEEVKLELTGESKTPVAALIKSGALDLSRPGTLAGYLPHRPPVLVEAEGSRLVIDLMRDPKLGKNPTVRRGVGLITSFLTVHGIETGGQHLDVVFRAFPRGYLAAGDSVKRHLVTPLLKRYLPALAR